MKSVLSLFLLVVLANSICRSFLQIQGKCTDCLALDTLVNGRCFPKLTGCLNYKEGGLCSKCQSGYAFDGPICRKIAQITGNVTLVTINVGGVNRTVEGTPPTVADSATRLNQSDLRGKYTQKYQSYLLNKYPQLAKATVKQFQTINTKKGNAIFIQYQAPNLTKYQASLFINQTDAITEFQFQANPTSRTDIVFAFNQLKTAISDRIKDYFVYNARKDGDNYVYDLMKTNTNNGDGLDALRVVVSKNDVNSPFLSTRASVKPITIADLGREEVVNLYPWFKDSRFSTPIRFSDYYVIYASANTSISYQFSNFNFVVNEPLVVELPSTSTVPSSFPVIGGFTQLTSFDDPWILECLQYIANQFPEIINTQQITKVQSQVVAGKNFIINLKSLPTEAVQNQYQFRVFHALDGSIQLFEGKKNNKTIYSKQYNYNADPTFFSGLKILQSQIKINPIPVVQSVTYKFSGNKKYYRSEHFNDSYSEFQVNTDTNKVTVLSFMNEGENLYKTLAKAITISAKRSNQTLLAFIKSKQTIPAESTIVDVNIKQTTYTVTLLSTLGTHVAVVEDKGSLQLTSYNRVSPTTCYTLSQSQIQENDRIASINDFIKPNYNLTNYELYLVQSNFVNNGNSYRFLYADDKLKQIQFYVDSINNQAAITKAMYLNNGFSVGSLDLNDADYAKFVGFLQKSTLAGSKVPFFIQSNSTTIKGYYDDGKTLYEIFIDRKTNIASTNVLSTKSYLILPDGFSLSGLLIPGNSTPTQDKVIQKIQAELLKKFSVLLTDSQLLYVSKTLNAYSLLYKSSLGYVKFDASVDSFGSVTAGNAVVTNYKDGDFSNCTKFSTAGKCLSCNTLKQVEYQGKCFSKMDGCLNQAGNICIKCNADYYKLTNKCVQDCTSFFK